MTQDPRIDELSRALRYWAPKCEYVHAAHYDACGDVATYGVIPLGAKVIRQKVCRLHSREHYGAKLVELPFADVVKSVSVRG